MAGRLVSVAQVLWLPARKKRRLLHLGSGATLLLGSRVGAVVVVVVMRLVALLDLGLIHWKKLSGQLRELHRVSEID